MTPIRLGFVGLSSNKGWASSILAPPLFQEPLSSKYRIVAVSTTNQDSATASAKKYSELTSAALGQSIENVEIKAYHGSTKHIAADPNVDLVVVSIKTMEHKEAALNAIEAGKDLFLQWPAGRDTKETEEINEAAKKKGVKSLVGTQLREMKFVNKIKSIIDSGKIGRVLSTTLILSYTHAIPARGKFTTATNAYLVNAANGAGMLDIAGGHGLDLFQYVLGPIASLTSTTSNPYPEAIVLDEKDMKPTGRKVPQDIPTQVATSGLLKNNAIFNFHLQCGVAEDAVKFLWLIDGEEGNIRVEDWKNNWIKMEPDIFVNGEKTDVGKEEDPYALVRRAWDAFADGRVGEYPSLEDAVRTRRVVDAIKESADTGRRVTLH